MFLLALSALRAFILAVLLQRVFVGLNFLHRSAVHVQVNCSLHQRNVARCTWHFPMDDAIESQRTCKAPPEKVKRGKSKSSNNMTEGLSGAVDNT